MKKFILCFSLILILLFSACSCNEKQKLYFDTWTSNSVIERNYTVTIGDYDSDGSYAFKAGKKSTYGNITVDGGEASITVKSFNETLPDEVDLKFKQALDKNNNELVYQMKTTLNLPVTFEKVNESYTDTMETTSYFFGKNLIPLYSITNSTTSYLGLEGNSVKVTRLVEENKTIYHSSSYTLTRTIYQEGDESHKTNSKKTYDYEVNTLIDNANILFALENYAISKDASKALNVVTATYGVEKGVTVKCYSKQSKVTVNGTDYSDVKLEAFCVTPESAGCFGGDTGKAQLVYLANDLNGNDKIIKYVSPLTSYDNSYTSLGALIFELNEN